MNHANVVSAIENRLDELGLTPAEVSRRATGQKDAIGRILKGRNPSLDRLSAIASELGLEFYVGPPRRHVAFQKEALVTQISDEDNDDLDVLYSPPRRLKPGAKIRDRRLTELFSAIMRHHALLNEYQREHFLADLWAAGGSGLRAQRR